MNPTSGATRGGRVPDRPAARPSRTRRTSSRTPARRRCARCSRRRCRSSASRSSARSSSRTRARDEMLAAAAPDRSPRCRRACCATSWSSSSPTGSGIGEQLVNEVLRGAAPAAPAPQRPWDGRHGGWGDRGGTADAAATAADGRAAGGRARPLPAAGAAAGAGRPARGARPPRAERGGVPRLLPRAARGGRAAARRGRHRRLLLLARDPQGRRATCAAACATRGATCRSGDEDARPAGGQADRRCATALEATPAKLELEALQLDLHRLERHISSARLSGDTTRRRRARGRAPARARRDPPQPHLSSAFPSDTRTSVRIVMDRETLAAMLAEGRSIESIARETGRARVDGRVLGQQARPDARRTRRATRARGGIEREQLEALVEEGLSIREIAERLRRVVHDRPPLAAAARAHDAARARLAETAPARAAGAETTVRELPVPRTDDVRARRAPDGFRCRSCHTEAVAPPAPRVKEILVAEAGGRCVLCGFDALRRRRCTSITRSGRRRPSRSPPGRHALAGRCASEAREVRAAVRELPRRGRGRDCATARVATTMSARPYSGAAFGGSSTAEHSAVNRRVVGSSPTPRATEEPPDAGGSSSWARCVSSAWLGAGAVARRALDGVACEAHERGVDGRRCAVARSRGR